MNAKFQEVFPRCFKGGQARLVLTDEENLLESGIEIIAQPPGKKNSTVEVLSGGEKAMTAVALIFAIFLIKPSPFCLLDEVDAPLDEANVGRYNDLIREMTDRSQFIVITHNKRTMQIADTLYGVTMEEPGISKLVSVNLGDRRQRAGQAPREPHRGLRRAARLREIREGASASGRDLPVIAVRALLAEAREVRRQRGELGELLVRVQLLGAAEEVLFGFDVVRIGDAALDRAHRLARLVVVEADALGAQVRIDHVDVVALGDRLVGALRLAGAAVDALLGNHRGHLRSSRPPRGTL